MVGVPRSAACQTCKLRKVKCDEKWPTCSSCAKRGVECPGPTFLLKFVHGGSQPNHAGQGESRLKPEVRSRLNKAISSSGSVPTTERSLVPLSRGQGQQAQGQQYNSFRLTSIPGKLYSQGDIVGTRLINCLETHGSLEQSWVAGFMRFMPPRLTHNPCLQDVVELFCSAFPDYQRDGVVTDVATMRLYGKTLRTLQATLKGSQARDIETLASIILLTRIEAFFDPGWKSLGHTHAGGIITLAQGLGVPKPGDRFHYGILYQTIEEMIFHSFSRTDEGFTTLSPWKEWLEENTFGFFPPELQSFAPSLLESFKEICAKGPKSVAKVRQIHQHPQLAEMEVLASKMRTALLKNYQHSNAVIEQGVNEAVRIGEIKEIRDPDFPAGVLYEMKINSCGSWFFTGLAFLVAITRVCYDLSALYGEGDAEELFALYRNASIRLWRFIPHQLEMHRAMSTKSISLIVLSYEAANAEESRYLEDVVWKYGRHLHRVPKDMDQCRQWIITLAKMMTGRIPVHMG